MKIQSKINTGIVAEWLSIIDPKMANDLEFEQKISAVIKSQTDLLLNSDLTEVRSKHWIITKGKSESGAVTIEFSLVAYSAKLNFLRENENDFNFTQVNRLRKKLNNAVAEENYGEAAKLRDLIDSIEKTNHS